MIYFFGVILGLLPSFIWLLFYLRQDRHPEPNRMVIKIFIWGMLIGPLAAVGELAIKFLLNPMPLAEFFSGSGEKEWIMFASVVFAAPLVEEYLKYRVVKDKVLKNPEMDEPLDIMLYMIIAALGFAAVENLLLIVEKPILPMGQALKHALSISGSRFLSATVLHALSSGILGYWLARSLREPQKKLNYLAKGFWLAIFFHAGYNYFSWLIEQGQEKNIILAIAAILLLFAVMAIMVLKGFSLLKKFHSVCRICPAPTKIK
ncbi:MAG: PrsW family intramembrane metalloprotease [Candidatus Portnoybacteria bacterium]|nr:PrsW family intramembrane metalloprotease [Candidatus Portnoybacteria bacterium]